LALSRQAITTVQPWSIKALVVHNPTPEEAPVTMASGADAEGDGLLVMGEKI
jgi:hypothetical protein